VCIDFCPTKENAQPARGPIILDNVKLEESKILRIAGIQLKEGERRPKNKENSWGSMVKLKKVGMLHMRISINIWRR